ncbi:MAG: hypothetical protein SGJ07_12215 [Rhodospirillaceae bacterium]|nr:hypothetical protein [Rhodospirillaceae bacterium]
MSYRAGRAFPFITAGVIALGIALAGPILVRADEVAAPKGAVIVTVIDAIGSTNRPPFDAFEDAFIGYHEYRFEKALELDRAMLEALGMQEATIDYAGWPGPIRFEGPLLRDVLDQAGATGDTITLVALDGYAERIERAELDDQDWILAIRGDGRDLGIGQHGPAWLVYQRRDGATATAEDEARWPWAVFLIAVE